MVSCQAFFSADKAVVRRSRVAYGKDKKQFIHSLHYNVHEYRVGNKTLLTMVAIMNLAYKHPSW
jgi:hypothetical protein